MPRQARKKSESGIYHTILRGINKQTIFEDEEDRIRFLSILRECKHSSGCKLLAWCLMGNHVHMAIKIEGEPLDLVFRRIAGKYAYWYNNKYQRIGHLFQDRYKSEPVEDDAYLLVVIRYIHQNPLEAGIVKGLEDYPYSSYSDYVNAHDDALTDTGLISSMMSIREFIRFHTENGNTQVMDVKDRRFYQTDEQARQLILEVSRRKSCIDIQTLDRATRDEILKELRALGLSIRQLSRLTGISKSVIGRQ